jgi:acetylglutamate kinase
MPPIIIKIGGVALEQQSESPALWKQILSLAQRHPGGVVLAHGGGKAVDRLLAQLGMETRRHEGLRITPPDQMDVIAGVLAGTLNKKLVGCINAQRRSPQPRAVGICLGDGCALTTPRVSDFPVDLGCVGDVNGGDAQLLIDLLAKGYLPVVACVGIDVDGTLLNVNGDDAAAGIARALRASTLVLLTDVPGILDKSKRVIDRASQADVRERIADGTISGGMTVKVLAAASTAAALNASVIIMNGSTTNDLESWIAGARVGTEILPT